MGKPNHGAPGALEELAARVKMVRERLGQTQAEFADALGVSRSFLSEMESGRSKPSVVMLVGIGATFPEIDRDWLLTGDGQMHRDDSLGFGGRWSGSFRAGSEVKLSDADAEAVLCAAQCLAIITQSAPERRNGGVEKDIISQFYNRYVGSYQDAMRHAVTKADPRGVADGYCKGEALKLAALPWSEDNTPDRLREGS